MTDDEKTKLILLDEWCFEHDCQRSDCFHSSIILNPDDVIKIEKLMSERKQPKNKKVRKPWEPRKII